MDGMFFKGAVVGGIAGTLFAAATVALAGAGIGGVFNLGEDNAVDGQTLLRGNTGGNPQLRVNNQQGGNGAVGVFGTHSAGAGKAAGVQGDTASAAAGAVAVFGRTTSANAAPDSAAVKGVNIGKGYGVYGQSTGSYGVFGQGKFGLVGTGSDSGVWATTGNNAGSGIYGQNTGVGGTGVRGFGGNGGWFSSSAANGTGVLGTVNGPGHGVRGEAEVNGSGVRGIGGNGGSFSSVVGNGTGVVGTVTGAGHGVRGEAGAGGIGVIGKNTSSGIGVYGTSQTGRAGVFDGQVDVNGYLRLAWSYGKPPDSDCNETSENGPMTVMVVNPQGGSYNEVWVCFGIAGWQGLRF